MPRGTPRCYHEWRKIGPAPSFQGQQCVLWRCDFCRKEQETFVGVSPGGWGRVVGGLPARTEGDDLT